MGMGWKDLWNEGTADSEKRDPNYSAEGDIYFIGKMVDEFGPGIPLTFPGKPHSLRASKDEGAGCYRRLLRQWEGVGEVSQRGEYLPKPFIRMTTSLVGILVYKGA